MSTSPEILRLSNLIQELLHSFYDCAWNFLTEETEKDLLIALSQVLEQVKQWTHESVSKELELLVETDNVDGECCSAATPPSNCCGCLANMIGNLMLLLSINIQYVHHLVGNTLSAISEFLLTIDIGWDDFLHLLCHCVELAISMCLASPSVLVIQNTGFSHHVPSYAKSLLKSKLKSANFSMVAELFRVLHKIQKYLKKKDSDVTMKAFLDPVCIIIINFDLATLRCMVDGNGSERTGVEDSAEANILFGSYIQLLCSLATQSISLEDEDGYSPIIGRIIELVPSLTSWCHFKPRAGYNIRISHYFSHKILELMVKLSSSIHLELTSIMTWMDLLQQNFGYILLEPIYGVRFDEDGVLEGSPFCSSLFTSEKMNMPSRHLQRLAVFLFLKFSFALVKKNNVNSDAESSNTDDVSAKLHKWLLAQAPSDIYVKGELSSEQCLQFSLSFLQLFMHEDDILFEVLLVLLRVPFHRADLIIEDEVKNPVLILISHLFNPVNLFHLFLSEISYDHQVLLDYLILKDTGSRCAEYILRSLRIVCDSWKQIVEEERGGGPILGAGECLIRLRKSIDRLNRKKLFPYNPRVLLQRLRRFEELTALHPLKKD